MFCGSISHAFSCKHETHDLLTLVSFYYPTGYRSPHSPDPRRGVWLYGRYREWQDEEGAARRGGRKAEDGIAKGPDH